MSKEVYATFVLPAPNGCNLDCPYCVIAQREEARQSVLTDSDYVRFLTGILADLPVKRFAIQGYEPLLPEVWPLTKSLLKIAGQFLCESTVITNGTYLADHAKELGGFPGLVDSLTVSLDSANARVHDKLRRKAGCFDAALAGIRAVAHDFKGELLVNSVLLPGRASYLEGMPELLASLGVREWAVSPLISVNKEIKVAHGEELKEDLLRLSSRAGTYGIKVFLSDELRLTAGNDLFEDFYVRSLGTNEEIFRLSPDGSCSRGVEVLGPSLAVPKWDGKEVPAEFVARIFGDVGSTVRKRSPLARALARGHADRVVHSIERRRFHGCGFRWKDFA